jgi:hypothetical protein
MPEIIPQIVGIVAVVVYLLSYQQKRRQGIIIFNVISRVLYILQYLLLGAFSGAALDVLGAVASVLAERKNTKFIKKHLKSVIISVNAVIIVVGVIIAVLNKSFLDLLPIAGVLLHTGAFWMNDEKIIRRISLIGSPFWLCYNFLSRAYGSAIGDALTIGSIIIAMIKYRDKKEAKKNEKS